MFLSEEIRLTKLGLRILTLFLDAREADETL